MPIPLLFSAFVMNTTSHILHGVWRQPDARQIAFNSLELWVNLAKELEAGLFDVIFLARPYGWLFNVSLTFRSQRAYTPCTNSLTIR